MPRNVPRTAGRGEAVHVHGAWVADDEVKAVCNSPLKEDTAVYVEVVLAKKDADGDGCNGSDRGELCWDAAHLVIGHRQTSSSCLQRRMRLGYSKTRRVHRHDGASSNHRLRRRHGGLGDPRRLGVSRQAEQVG